MAEEAKGELLGEPGAELPPEASGEPGKGWNGPSGRAVAGKVEWDSYSTLEAIRWVLTHSKNCDEGKGNHIKLYREMYQKNPAQLRKLMLSLEEEERQLEMARLAAQQVKEVGVVGPVEEEIVGDEGVERLEEVLSGMVDRFEGLRRVESV